MFPKSVLVFILLTAVPAGSDRIVEGFGSLPLSFEPNRGQSSREFTFSSRSYGYSILLNATAGLMKFENKNSIGWHLVGADSKAALHGIDRLPGESNYFIGSKDNWITHVPTFRRVEGDTIYPGIDVVYYGNRDSLEYDFVIHPGATPEAIRFRFDGASRVVAAANGDLVITTGKGDIRQPLPTAFQDIDGVRTSVGAKYAFKSDGSVVFFIGAYDRSKALVIDPQLVYSIYVGNLNYGHGIAVDPAGNILVCGETADPWDD